MNKKLKALNWQIKVLDQENRIIEMIGSTEDFDRANDSMKMSGVILDNYKKNPVILANHSRGYDEKPTVIGKALDVRIEGTKLIFKIQFAETANAKDWFYLYANGYMNASSIGFKPIKYEPNDQGGYDYTEWELLELSLVAVPCNPNAVQRAFEDNKISKAFYDAYKQENGGVKVKVEAIKKMLEEAVKPYKEKISALETEKAALVSQNSALIEKSGASISAANKEKLQSIHDKMAGCMKGLGEAHEELKAFVDKPDDGQEDPEKEINLDDFNIKDFKDDDEIDISAEELKTLITDVVKNEINNHVK